MTEKKEEDLIQLVLTQDEATILGSITTLGIRTFTGDFEAAAYTKTLLTSAITLWPVATATLSEKMIAVNKATMKCTEEELDEIEMDSSRTKKV